MSPFPAIASATLALVFSAGCGNVVVEGTGNTDASACPGGGHAGATDPVCANLAVLGKDTRLIEWIEDEWPQFGITPEGSELAMAWTHLSFAGDDNTDLYFTRLGVTGEPVGSKVPIEVQSWMSHGPAVVSMNSDFAVVWSDWRHGDPDSELYYQRVSGDAPVGPEVRLTDAKLGDEKPALDAAAYPGMFSLAFEGDRYGIAWEDFRLSDNSEIYFALLSSDGEKIGEDVRVTTAPENSFNPSVAFAAGAFRIVWEDLRDGNLEIYSAGVSANGVKLGEDLRVTNAPGYTSDPVVGRTGDQLVILWEDGRDDPGHGIYSAALACP